MEQNQIFSKKAKVSIAFGILRAISFLHNTCGILHRDVKSDNILIKYDTCNDVWQPILIDFSLAKPIRTNMWGDNSIPSMTDMEHVLHTGEVGTLVYTAPEVMDHSTQGRYGPPMDLYSVGIVLLELLRNEMISAEKYKEIVKQVQDAKEQLSSHFPFPNLILRLLECDPSSRITASEGLIHPIFPKFGLHDKDTVSRVPTAIDFATALPYPDPSLPDPPEDLVQKENRGTPTNSKSFTHTEKAIPRKKQKKYESRLKIIDKVLYELESTHPWTRSAALDYSIQMEQLDDQMDQLSQSLLDCCVLAYRFWERNVLDLEDLHDRTTGLFQSWDYEEYVDNESTMFMMLDYCLYPREILTK
jgi:serine/threonine protein kinase